MSTDTASLFFALLTLAANAGTLVLAALAWAGPRRRRGVAADLWDVLGDGALWLAWIVAATTVVGSLWFSEVADLVPCTLCWYQRIALYPLALVLLVAAWQEDRRVARYVLPLTAVGAVVSTYHYLLEWFPDLDAGACDATVPCTIVWFRRFGFVSLPYMALSAGLFITALVLRARVPHPTDDLEEVQP